MMPTEEEGNEVSRAQVLGDPKFVSRDNLGKSLASPAAESEKDGRVSATTPREKLHGTGGMDSNTSLPLLLLR